MNESSSISIVSVEATDIFVVAEIAAGETRDVHVLGNADEADVIRSAGKGHVTVALDVDGRLDQVLFASAVSPGYHPTTELLEASIRALQIALAAVRRVAGDQ